MSDQSFYETHAESIATVLSGVQEIALYHPPFLVVEGNPLDGEVEISINGQSMTDEYFETRDGSAPSDSEIDVELQCALSTLGTLGVIAVMSLLAHEVKNKFPETPESSMPERTDEIDRIQAIVRAEIDEGRYCFTKHLFTDEESKEGIIISDSVLVSNSGTLSARSVEIERQDGVITKKLSITVLPVLLSGTQETVVTHELKSAAPDDLLKEAGLLFGDNAESDMPLVISIFKGALDQDSENISSQILLDRYKATPQYEPLKQVIAALQDRALGVRVNTEMLQANPEIGFPSDDDMQDYLKLLGRICM